jgi:hypothetical protein
MASSNEGGPAIACDEPALTNDLRRQAKIYPSNTDSPNHRQDRVSLHVLDRRVFATSRLAEFTSQKELTTQTGTEPSRAWKGKSMLSAALWARTDAGNFGLCGGSRKGRRLARRHDRALEAQYCLRWQSLSPQMFKQTTLQTVWCMSFKYR